MPLLVSLLMLALAGLQTQTGSVPLDTGKWLRFRDEAHRLSFAYPPELRLTTSPAEELHGLPGWENRVLLVAHEPGGAERLPVLAVSVFICDDPALDPRVPCVDDSYYRKVCDRFEEFPLGDASAIQCVTYGSAACQWSAIVLLQQGSVRITAPAAERFANWDLKTHTRADCADAVVAIRTQSPLKQVLASFRFR